MPLPPRTGGPTPVEIEAWLTELGLEPVERADRDGIMSWDVVLDGRRRSRLRITLILDPSLALICWAHFAPPISDSFRKSYRKLLRWNDELPFIKFSISEDERPILVAEIAVAALHCDVLGLALARQLAVADRFQADTAEWLKAGGWPVGAPPASAAVSPGVALLQRYASDLAEFADPAVAAEPVAAEPAAAEPPAKVPSA